MIFLYSYPHPWEGRQKQELQSHSLQNENHNHRKVTKIITWITALHNCYEPCCAGPPKMDESWWRPTGEGNGKPPSIFASRTPWTAWKGRKIWHQKMSPSGQKVYNMLLGKCGETVNKEWRVWTKAEMMLSCWFFMEVRVKSDAVKNTIA